MHIFGHSPFLQPYMLSNSSMISVLILIPMISTFLEIDILSRESFKGFYRVNHVFLWKRHQPNQKRGLCHLRIEGG